MFTPHVVKVVEIGDIEFTRQSTEQVENDPNSRTDSHIAIFDNNELGIALVVTYTNEGAIRNSYLSFGKGCDVKLNINIVRDVSNVTIELSTLMQIAKWANNAR